MHTLDCTGLRQLSDASLEALGAGCPALCVLMLTWVVQVTDRGVCAIARGCPHLVTVSLHGIKGVGEASLDALAAGCAASLIELDVRGCIGIPESIRTPECLVQRWPWLRKFALAT